MCCVVNWPVIVFGLLGILFTGVPYFLKLVWLIVWKVDKTQLNKWDEIVKAMQMFGAIFLGIGIVLGAMEC